MSLASRRCRCGFNPRRESAVVQHSTLGEFSPPVPNFLHQIFHDPVRAGFSACPKDNAKYFIFMSSVKEIESAISKLPRNDLTELESWFAEFTADAWDRQIEDDARSGRLDVFYQRLQKENGGEPDVPLNEVLDKEKLS
jgi:hypothetical protein